MWKLIAGGVALLVGYEYFKKKKLAVGPIGGFTMVPGHLMAISYQGGVAGTPPTQAQAQAALNAGAPGLYNVLSSQGSYVPGSFTVSAIFEGPSTMQESAASLTAGWSKPNSIVVATVQDFGAAAQQAVATAAGAA